MPKGKSTGRVAKAARTKSPSKLQQMGRAAFARGSPSAGKEYMRAARAKSKKR